MIKILRIVVFIAILAAVAALLWPGAAKKPVDVSQGRVSEVREMARLCAVELYSEVPVLDTINNKVLFAIQKQSGSVEFDVDSLVIDATGDTVLVVLPPEIVELHEAAEPDSWQVIDTKNIGFMGAVRSDRLTDDEENQIKARVKSRSLRRLYQDGAIARARAEGAENLRVLLRKLYRKPVVVTDPTPRCASAH